MWTRHRPRCGDLVDTTTRSDVSGLPRSVLAGLLVAQVDKAPGLRKAAADGDLEEFNELYMQFGLLVESAEAMSPTLGVPEFRCLLGGSWV